MIHDQIINFHDFSTTVDLSFFQVLRHLFFFFFLQFIITVSPMAQIFWPGQIWFSLAEHETSQT